MRKLIFRQKRANQLFARENRVPGMELDAAFHERGTTMLTAVTQDVRDSYYARAEAELIAEGILEI